jgi:hypothetical protein
MASCPRRKDQPFTVLAAWARIHTTFQQFRLSITSLAEYDIRLC